MLDTVRRHPLAAAGLVAGAAALAVRPSRLDPVEWHPPDPPAMEGPLAPDDALTRAETVVSVDGPEDVAFDDDGYLYTGSVDGTLYRTLEPVDDGTDLLAEPVAETRGRPLGLTVHDGRLLVCAESAGLVAVALDDLPHGGVEPLVRRADGRRVAFADDLHVVDDTVYFTDATEHDLFQDELFELRDTGRLVAYDLATGEVEVVLGNLGFANGVAPGPDGESLLITETSRYRVTRYFHRGDRAGEAELFAANLAGYPDNIERDDDGYLVAVPALRDAALDRVHESPWLVRLLGKLPEAVLAQVSGDPYGLVLRLDETGAVVDSYHDPTGGVYSVTSATPHDGALYLGTLDGDRVVRFDPG